jgi:hypothetical protein
MRIAHHTALSFVALASLFASLSSAQAVRTELKNDNGHFTLLRDGQPYFIHGAGGDASKPFLKQCGGNSFRTWGADDIDDKLAEAQKLGLTVTVGIWLGHERHHFDYNNEAQVQAQFERAKAAVLKYRNNPAVLMWSVGNEMEGYKEGDNPKIWKAVEDIAKMIHELDPNHPTMTIVAEIGGKRVPCINQYCPDIDVVGINSYGGGPSLAERYRAAGGVKPFVITEFGPGGTWEVAKNSWGVPLELTSTAKAPAYRATYEKSVLAEKGKLCLGSYAFAWGNKQEATATWYGLFLADGTRLETTDTLTELWSGKKPANRCPVIQPLKIDQEKTKPGETVHVTLDVKDPEGDPLKVEWKLYQDPAMYDTGGDTQPEPRQYPDAIVSGDTHGAVLKMPKDGGGFWLYAFVYDDHGGAAVADAPLWSDGPIPKPKVRVATLPLVLYGPGQKELPYVWSGWMGDVPSIKMDEKSTVQPHTGDTCMRCEVSKNWGGIIWQSPANDWGEEPGGFDLTGARKLTVWARGEKGGEPVTFKLGVIKDKKYSDSDEAHLDTHLTTEWKKYTIDLGGKDLSDIKTGFGWTTAAHNGPVVFYLSEIQYEPADGTEPAAAAPDKGAAATLPFALYDDSVIEPPYVWSGWMGDAANIAMDEKLTDHPHSGKTCMKCQFKAGNGFGGIVWQSPANDWGEQPGGYDLTGAKKLTFWARGENGGELVDFKLGVIGADKPHHDSASAELKDTTLTKEWKQYTIDLTNKKLTDIKTGFVWVVGAKGEPVTFYLDDIRYE